MMTRFVPIVAPLATAVLLVLGCSGRVSVDPIHVDTAPGAGSSGPTAQAHSNCHMLWGMYQVAIDSRTLDVEIVPTRSACFNANVTMFMQPPLAPVNLIRIQIDPTQSDIPNGLFAVDVTLSHPFPGLSQYSGFDVRGIFMAEGGASSSHFNNLYYATADEAQLLNADGWTRWWNPTEFTTFNKIFGYTQGKLAPPGYLATATLNPYKYFCDGLGSEDELYIDPDTRGFFSALPGLNTRRYLIQFTMDGGKPLLLFNYAVDASWEEPDPAGGPDYTPDDFTLSANCQEAYQVSASDAGSTAWYIGPSENGGNLLLDICVYDWQTLENPDGVPGEVSAIWVESPMLLGAPVDVLPGATVLPDGPTSSIFRVEIADVTPTGLTGQTLMVAVESSSPTDYAPQIDGVTGFAYPAEPLAAYIFWDAPILNEQPVQIPTPTGLDNCAAAGAVKLFWDPVDWPTLAGYNVYKKESTVPDFDFDAPLNTELVTETVYVDTDVLMNGTSYDYVVTAVDVDTTESNPSNQTSATPVYNPPTSFTDLDNPDGEMGNTQTSDFVNACITEDGTIFLVYALPTRFVRAEITNPTSFEEVYLGSYAYGRWADVAADSQENGHVVWTNTYANARRYYYAMVTPGNSVQHFATIHQFDAPTGWEGESTIAVTPDDEVHIIFPSYDGSYNLAYVHGQPGALSSPEVLTYQVNPDLYHMRPDMASDRFGNVHVAWTGPGGDILYMKRDPDGAWGSIENVSSGISGYDNWAAIAVDYLGAVHIAWHISSATYHPGYANNRTGSWQGFSISSMPSGNCVGVAVDPDGNAYVDTWTGSSGDHRVRVALINRSNSVVQIMPVNDDTPYDGSWCSFAGQTDPCFEFEAKVLATWRDFPPSLRAKYARIRADY